MIRAKVLLNRRYFLVAGGSLVATSVSGLLVPTRAQGLAPTRSMRGGSNNYRPSAPILDRIGGGGFMMTGTVRRAGDGVPLAGRRIQIWAHTTEGYARWTIRLLAEYVVERKIVPAAQIGRAHV